MEIQLGGWTYTWVDGQTANLVTRSPAPIMGMLARRESADEGVGGEVLVVAVEEE